MFPFNLLNSANSRRDVVSYKGSTGYPLAQACPGKGLGTCTCRPDMTIVVNWDIKLQTKNISPKVFIMPILFFGCSW